MFMSWVAVVMSSGLAAWKRVKELHGKIVEPNPEEEKLRQLPLSSTGSLLSVELEFWDRPLALKIPEEKWTVLIGETGSGKTYLLSKLATALILQGRKVSMVQQEPYLFNDTIQENIFLGKTVDEKLLDRAKRLLRIFLLDGLEDSVAKVLGLEVGENGKRLSGGQMKRVALVRSLLSEADYIIWDDPFSSVDIILEKRIIEELRKSPDVVGKTFIISSHRLTTVRLSHQVIYVSQDLGIEVEGPVQSVLKDQKVVSFFKEQMVDLSLA
jgi:ATP-binding cassette subfamily B protein